MNTQIREEAAEWLVEFRVEEVDAPARERFAEWLRASPEHVRAYLELVALWEDAQRYDAGHRLDVASLIALARGDANVIALESRGSPFEPTSGALASASSAERLETDSPPGPEVDESRSALLAYPARRTHRVRVWRLALAAGLAAVFAAVVVGVWVAYHHDPIYATDVGEQRTIKLADGSIAELNAVSRIRIRFSQHDRRIDLLGGQALFKVVKDRARPFVVRSGDTRIQALGTEFDVNRKTAGTVVTVLEGQVAVMRPPDSGDTPTARSESPPPLELSAGEQVAVTRAAPARKSRANLAAATAWTQQQLIFESTPLEEVADEFNRFNAQKLIVRGHDVRNLNISGNFPALDPTSLARFVRFLRTQPGIDIAESADQIVVSEK